MALLHFGTFHSNSTSGREVVFGRYILTLRPVALMYPISTRPASAVAQRRAMGPPPVSRARWSPVRLSNQRGDMTQVYLPLKSRFWGWGMVVWFHGWFWSTGLPRGSFGTNFSEFSQLS